MINKKRLVMMAVAASMVLPTNLTYLSMATSVLANTEDPISTTTPGELTSTEDDPTLLTAQAFTDLFEETKSPYKKKNGNKETEFDVLTLKADQKDITYKLKEPVTLSKRIQLDNKSLKIDLNGQTITSSDLAFELLNKSTLEISDTSTAPGSIETTAATVITVRGEDANLTVNNKITLKTTNNYGDCITISPEKSSGDAQYWPKNAQVNITDATLEAWRGININGTINDYVESKLDNKIPTINLENVKIPNALLGAYQAGVSTFTLTNCTITASSCGIETRVGTLNIIGGSITGGTKPAYDNEFRVRSEGSGNTTLNAGIAVAPHSKVNEIKVDIQNATVKGIVALAVTDPESNTDYNSSNSATLPSTFNVKVSNSTLDGTQAGIGYTIDKENLTLSKNTYSNAAAKKLKFNSSNVYSLSGSKDFMGFYYLESLVEAEVSFKDLTVEDINTSGPKVSLNGETVNLSDCSLTYFEVTDGNVSTTSTTTLEAGKSYQVLIEPKADSTKYTDSITADFTLPAEEGPITVDKVTVTVEPATEESYDLFAALNEVGGAVQLDFTTIAPEGAESDGTYEPNYAAIGEELTTQVTENLSNVGGLATYTYTVESKSSNDDPDVSESKVAFGSTKAVVKVQLNATSKIRLIISPKSEKQVAFLALEEAETADTTETVVKQDDGTVVITDTVANITGDTAATSVTGDQIINYLGNSSKLTGNELKDLNIPSSFTLNASKTTSYGLENIDSEGYFFMEVTAPENLGGTTAGGSGHKPAKPKPEEPTTPGVGTPTTMYRLYNRLTGEHLYTIDKNERDNLLTSDTWKDEGEGWIAPSVSDYPVYRLLNPNNGDHHYTTDKNEFDTLPTLGWVAEGVAFFSADKDNPENVLLHRLYNPNAEGAGSHHYTADTNERDTLVSQGWKYEGLAWAGLPANK